MGHDQVVAYVESAETPGWQIGPNLFYRVYAAIAVGYGFF